MSSRPPVLTEAEKAERGDAPIVPQDEGTGREERPAESIGEIPEGGTPGAAAGNEVSE